MELTEQEKEIHAIIKAILKDKKSYKTTLKHALKFCNKALKSNGLELKEACQYILGNAIYWDGENYQELKLKLRKFCFRAAVVYDREKFTEDGED